MDCMTAMEASVKWGITRRRVQKLCEESRIDGVLHFGQSCMIPRETNKPADARIKSGKYVKKADNRK